MHVTEPDSSDPQKVKLVTKNVLVGTYRDTEVGRKHPLGQALAEQVRERGRGRAGAYFC